MSTFSENYYEFIDIFIAKLNKNLKKRYPKCVLANHKSTHTLTYENFLESCPCGLMTLPYREIDTYCILLFEDKLFDLVPIDEFHTLVTGIVYSFEYYFKKGHKLNVKLETTDSDEFPYKTKYFLNTDRMLWSIFEVQIEDKTLECYFLFSIDHLTMLFDQPRVINKTA